MRIMCSRNTEAASVNSGLHRYRKLLSATYMSCSPKKTRISCGTSTRTPSRPSRRTVTLNAGSAMQTRSLRFSWGFAASINSTILFSRSSIRRLHPAGFSSRAFTCGGR